MEALLGWLDIGNGNEQEQFCMEASCLIERMDVEGEAARAASARARPPATDVQLEYLGTSNSVADKLRAP